MADNLSPINGDGTLDVDPTINTAMLNKNNSSSTEDSGIMGSSSSGGEQPNSGGGIIGIGTSKNSEEEKVGKIAAPIAAAEQEEEEEATNDTFVIVNAEGTKSPPERHGQQQRHDKCIVVGPAPNCSAALAPAGSAPAASASASSVPAPNNNSTSMLSNMVGYARSRLFRHANDGLVPTTNAPSSSLLHQRQHQQNQSQSASGTPTKGAGGIIDTNSSSNGGGSPWKMPPALNAKSCPVPRRQLLGNNQQQQNYQQIQLGESNGSGLSGDSLSVGSRESVAISTGARSAGGGGSGFLDSTLTIGGGNPSLCSSRTSWQQQQQQQNGTNKSAGAKEAANKEHWQLFAVTLHRASQGGFGIAISGSGISHSNNSESGTSSSTCGGGILVSDVIANGPAFGLLQVGDRITSCNGYPLEHADYGSAVAVMKEAQQLNMIVKRRVPVPFVEFEQRTLKFTLSKSRKKDDFGIVLGCRFYIKEILNPKLAEKEPGLKEGDTVLRINGQTLDAVTLEEASRLLQRSREKLSLVVQRDVRRGGAGAGGGTSATSGNGSSRWPSQTTVYERLGSLQATPRQSPLPAHYGFAQQHQMGGSIVEGGQYGGYSRKGSAGTEVSSVASGGGGSFKRFSDPMTGSVRVDYCPPAQNYAHQQPAYHQQQQQPLPMLMQMNNNGRPMFGATAAAASEQQQQQQHSSSHQCPQSPYMHAQRLAVYPAAAATGQPQQSLQTRAQSQTPSSVQSLPMAHQNAQQQQQLQPNISSDYEQQQQQQQRWLMGQQQQQSFAMGPQQPNMNAATIAQQQQHQQQQRCVRQVNFQKGPQGLGIRVIGGNQVGIFVSAVQEQSPADQHGIRVGDRIHGVNGVSIAGLTREEAFDVLLSLGEHQIGLALENCPEEFAQVKAGKFADSFYIRTHFAYSSRATSNGCSTSTIGRGGNASQQQQQLAGGPQPAELSFQPGDIFHVTDTLFGGSPGFWQVTKVYSAVDAEQKGSSGGTGGGGGANNNGSSGQPEPNSGIIPHAKLAEQMMRQQRQAAAAAADKTGVNGSAEQSGGSGTLSRSLFRKKLSLTSRKFFGGSSGTSTGADPMEELLMSGGSANYASELTPPAYERVALKRPAFHRPVVLFGPLADVARQLLLTQSGLRFGAPLPSAGPSAANGLSGGGASAAIDPMMGSTSSERGIRLGAVDSVMAAQKHCVLCVSPGSVERLQLAQYAPIVVLIDVDSRSRVRELRTKAGAGTQSAKKLLEQAQRIKRQHSHLLTATLDASKEDQWFEALRALIFHLQERRVWMPEFQPEQSLDDLLLFPLQQPGETPTSDGDKSDYGGYEPGPPQQQQQQFVQSTLSRQHQQHLAAPGSAGPFMVSNPVYSLTRGQAQQQQSMMASSTFGNGQQQQQQHHLSSSSARPSPAGSTAQLHQNSRTNSARNSPFPGGIAGQQGQQQNKLSVYSGAPEGVNQQTATAASSPREQPTAKSQLLAQLASELGSPRIPQQRQ